MGKTFRNDSYKGYDSGKCVQKWKKGAQKYQKNHKGFKMHESKSKKDKAKWE